MPFPHLSGTCYSPEALSVSVRSLPEAWGFALLTEIKFMQHSRLYSSVAFGAYITLSRPSLFLSKHFYHPGNETTGAKIAC